VVGTQLKSHTLPAADHLQNTVVILLLRLLLLLLHTHCMCSGVAFICLLHAANSFPTPFWSWHYWSYFIVSTVLGVRAKNVLALTHALICVCVLCKSN